MLWVRTVEEYAKITISGLTSATSDIFLRMQTKISRDRRIVSALSIPILPAHFAIHYIQFCAYNVYSNWRKSLRHVAIT